MAKIYFQTQHFIKTIICASRQQPYADKSPEAQQAERFCSGREGKTKRDAILLYASPVISACTPSIFKHFHTYTESNGGRSREVTEEVKGGGKQRSCKCCEDRRKGNLFTFSTIRTRLIIAQQFAYALTSQTSHPRRNKLNDSARGGKEKQKEMPYFCTHLPPFQVVPPSRIELLSKV